NVTTFADVVDPNDGVLSLREAITLANDTTTVADTIQLQAGVYKITIPPDPNPPAPGTSGSFAIRADTTLVGAGAGTTVIDGGHLDRVFTVNGSSADPIGVSFQGLTVTGGESKGDGGGILMAYANLTLSDCVVSGNTASGDGGGISNAAAPGTGNLTLVR